MRLFGLNNNKCEYSESEILNQLDNCAKDFTFPMLDNGYVYLIDSRLSAYRDNTRWVLIIEIIGFNYRMGGHNGINNCLYIFGNCLQCNPGTDNKNFINITSNSKEGNTFDEEFEEFIKPSINSMLIRNKEIKITHDLEFYKARGIDLEEPPKIFIWEFLRAINLDYKNDFFATELEIRQRIPDNIPMIIRLNEWYHNDLANGENPSDNNTFKMIAKVIYSGNTNYYKPKISPNNHWKNWPDGGML